MRITEDRQTRRPKLRRQRRRAPDIGDALLRQPIHQIEVDGGNPHITQMADRRLDNLQRLHATDGALHVIVQILHTQARPRDADLGEGARQIRIDRARIELDRMFRDIRQIEELPQRRAQAQQAFRSHEARRTSAPVDVRDAPRAGRPCQQRHFLFKRRRIGVQRLAAPHGLCIAAAIGADRRAVGHVQIERERGLRRERSEPAARGLVTHGREMRRGRVARVARGRAFRENEGRFSHGHEAFSHAEPADRP